MPDDDLTSADRDERAVDPEQQARREFLKRLSAASASVPAVSLLLAANFKAASAQEPYGGGCGGTGCGGSTIP
jgi:hypothetical protein